MASMEVLPAALRKRRTDLGLTLAQVARRAGTSASTLCRYEGGWRRFELATLRKLAASLECTLEVRLVPRGTPHPVDPGAGLDRLGRLFWDRKLVKSDLANHARWVVGRVVEYGDLQDIRFLAGQLGTGRFLCLTEAVRFSSKKAAQFWRSIRAMEGTKCTKRRSRPEAGGFWRP